LLQRQVGTGNAAWVRRPLSHFPLGLPLMEDPALFYIGTQVTELKQSIAETGLQLGFNYTPPPHGLDTRKIKGFVA
jgi:hypothetical protein